MAQTNENELPLKVSSTAPSQDRLRELLNYDSETGILTWRIRPSNRVRVGDIAGTLGNHGYWQLQIGGTIYLAHRIIWVYVYGYWPDEIDHKDTIRNNNRLCNLREATGDQNKMNVGVRADNMLGIKGIAQYPSGSYYARISVDGVEIHLGTFKTLEEAINARQAAAKKYFGEFCHEDERQEETRFVD